MNYRIFLMASLFLLPYLNAQAKYKEVIINYNKQKVAYEIRYWACPSNIGVIEGAVLENQPNEVVVNGGYCFVTDLNVVLQDGTKLNYHYNKDNLGGYGDHTWAIRPDNTIALIQ